MDSGGMEVLEVCILEAFHWGEGFSTRLVSHSRINDTVAEARVSSLGDHKHLTALAGEPGCLPTLGLDGIPVLALEDLVGVGSLKMMGVAKGGALGEAWAVEGGS